LGARTEALFSYVSREARVPLDHPLRAIRPAGSHCGSQVHASPFAANRHMGSHIRAYNVEHQAIARIPNYEFIVEKSKLLACPVYKFDEGPSSGGDRIGDRIEPRLF
jgi:hypothetical protein